MPVLKNTLGIALGGGKSTRMGLDKSLIAYFGKPQVYHIYDLLKPLCEKTVISCSGSQLAHIPADYNVMPDLPDFENIGPMGALLSAFQIFPENDLLVIGCDYPFLSAEALNNFLNNRRRDSTAAAFYNRDGKYEPLLAWYSQTCGPLLKKCYERKEYSLQHFLRLHQAEKYEPDDEKVMTSVDTPEQFRQAKMILDNSITESK